MMEYKECFECANCCDPQDGCARHRMFDLEKENDEFRSLIIKMLPYLYDAAVKVYGGETSDRVFELYKQAKDRVE